MHKIKSFLSTRTKTQRMGGIIVLLVVSYFILHTGKSELVMVAAERGTIEQEVLATGKTKPAESVDLGFERGGKVASARVKVGSRVRVGQTLVILDQSTLLANLQRSEAALAEARASLSNTSNTSSSSFTSARENALLVLANSYTVAADAIHHDVDRFYLNPEGLNPTFVITYTSGTANVVFGVDENVARNLSAERQVLNQMLTNWDSNIKAAQVFSGDLTESFTLSQKNIALTKIFLSRVATAVNSVKNYDQSHETTMAGYRSLIASARSSVDAIEAELLTAKSKYESAPREATIGADQGLDQVLAGQARVDAAAANVAADKAELSKTIITSPIAGIVTRQDAKQGQIVSTGSTLISVISDQHLEIEANVSEVNISKVAVGNSVEVSFDSFPSLILKAKIVYVDPGEVLVGGVVNYKVTVEFDEVIPTTLKSGLTANLKILTARKDDVIKVPVYAVTKRSGVSYARVMVGDTIEERKVTTGLLGKDGTVEILTGISFGESVLIDASQTE